ncbi:MAG TPA: MFS transporter [Jatrophihabitans sp.]|nr:MFS transporter [Jatrophihabitans sp.]
MALLALSPFIVVSTAGQLIQPQLLASLHTSTFGIELTNALANAGYAFGAVLAADLIQRLPARRLYLACEIAFVAGSLLSAFSGNLAEFLVGRAVQGLATGMLLVAALPPLVTRFGVGKLPATAAVIDLGLFGMVTVGPLVGALSAGGQHWRVLFVVLAGLAVLGIVCGLLGFSGGEQTSDIGFDWSAIPVAFAAAVLPFLGVAWAVRDGFTSPGFLVPVIVGVLVLLLLLFRQYRKDEALMPLKMIAHTLPVTGIIVAMTAGAAVTALVELDLVYLLEAQKETPLTAGATLTTQVGGVIAAAWLFARAIRTRWLPALAVLGLIVVGGGGALLLALTPGRAIWLTALVGVLLGFGAGAGVSPALFMAGLSAPSDRLGPTFALVELLRSEAAYLVAPVVLQIALLQPHLGDGVTVGALISIGVCVLGLACGLPVLLLSGVRPHAPDLSRWLDEHEPAYHSPPVAAAVRDV